MKMIVVASAISVAINISSSRSRMRSSINVPPSGQTRSDLTLLFLCDPTSLRPRHERASVPVARKPDSVVLVRRAAGLLDELVDQPLTDATGDVLVDGLHRLAHGGVLLGRQLDDLALAGLDDLGERIVVLLLRL